MAQVKYKHGTVQHARHIARNSINSAYRILNGRQWNAEQSLVLMDINNATCAAEDKLRGRRGFDKEQQVERLKGARADIEKALKLLTRFINLSEDATSHEENAINFAHDSLTAAKEHLTSAAQFAKDRRFESKTEPEPVAPVVIDVELGNVDPDTY